MYAAEYRLPMHHGTAVTKYISEMASSAGREFNGSRLFRQICSAIFAKPCDSSEPLIPERWSR
jgi:hypothetical protein